MTNAASAFLEAAAPPVPRRELIRLAPLVREAICGVTPAKVRRAGVEMSVPWRVVVRADRVQLLQALHGLIEDAVAGAAAAGSVAIAARRLLRGRVMITIARGARAGGPDAALLSLFDRFFRAPAMPSAPGVGLELAIAKRIVLAHGGQIWAERPLAGGSAIRLVLPP